MLLLLGFMLALPLMAKPAELTVRSLTDPIRVQLCRGAEVALEIEGATSTEGRRAADLAMRADSRLRVTTREDRALVWSGDDLLAEISQQQSARWGTTPYSLARTFASRLEAARSGKTPPPPALEPTRLTVPLGETRPARWLNQSGTPKVTVSDPSVAAVFLTGNEVRVTGTSRGEATITLSWDQTTLNLPVVVRPWAARLPNALEVPFSGDMPRQEALRRVLLSRAWPHPAARMEMTFPKSPPTNPEAPIPIEIQASGPGLLTAQAKVQVRFKAVPIQIYQAGALVMSNRPEKILAEGTLLHQALPAAPVRLLIHHYNLPQGPERFLEVLLRNPSDAPARVFLALEGVGPSADEIFAGHLATRRFLERMGDQQGVTLQLGAGETVLVERLRMKPGQTVSAMGWLQPLREVELDLTVRAVDGQGQAPDQDLAPAGTGPFSTGRGLFPAEVHASYAHDLGSRYGFIPLGDAPFTQDPLTGELNPGNFGVVYRLRLILRNPTSEAREARLFFRPRGGPARGHFFVDGAFAETDNATSSSPYLLGRWSLAPEETREVFLETFPQSGSNYPVTLEVQSDFVNLPSAPQPQSIPLPPRWMP